MQSIGYNVKRTPIYFGNGTEKASKDNALLWLTFARGFVSVSEVYEHGKELLA